MSLLEIEKLSIDIAGAPILRGIDIAIEKGAVMGLVGESGSGKSMTALAIMQLLPYAARASGRVTFDGIDLLAAPEAAMNRLRGNEIGMVFQEPMTALNPLKTIGEQIAEGIRWHTGASRASAEGSAKTMLERVGMPVSRFPLTRYPHELSGGQRQRVVIAIACALKPKLLIADEPTTALDVVLQAQILELLRELVDDMDMALLLISHDLAVVADMADRVTVMRHGEVMEAGETVDTLTGQRHPYTRQLAQASTHVPARTSSPLRGGESHMASGGSADIPTSPSSSGSSRGSASAGGISTHETGNDPTFPATGHRTVDPRDKPEDDGVGSDASAAATGSTAREGSHPAAAPPSGPSDHLPLKGGEDVPLLEVENVGREYPGRRSGLFSREKPFRAVDGVSFSLERGQSVALVGRSGCGKSTLARMILALDRPTGGAIRFDGHDLTGLGEAALRPARRNMQVVFQDPYGSFDPRQTVERLVAEPLHLMEKRPSAAERREMVAQALADVGLSADDMEKYPHEFSGGQRQRISIARAIIMRPKLIVADEPVSALDVSIRAQILDLFADLNSRLGVAYLFITHDLTVARAITDDVMVMDEGRIVERGRTHAILDDPQTPAARALVDAAPDLQRAIERRNTR